MDHTESYRGIRIRSVYMGDGDFHVTLLNCEDPEWHHSAPCPAFWTVESAKEFIDANFARLKVTA